MSKLLTVSIHNLYLCYPSEHPTCLSTFNRRFSVTTWTTVLTSQNHGKFGAKFYYKRNIPVLSSRFAKNHYRLNRSFKFHAYRVTGSQQLLQKHRTSVFQTVRNEPTAQTRQIMQIHVRTGPRWL
jgi:hypothetical protein